MADQTLDDLARAAGLEPDTLAFAKHLDSIDPLREHRAKFHFPRREHSSGSTTAADEPYRYFCGNSLGLQHVGVEAAVCAELAKWRTQAVEGHFLQPNPWFEIDDVLRDAMAKIVGAADASEVVVMNTLTVNLHLLMAAFYKPRGAKRKILAEAFPFPSDTHALVSQAAHHGFTADDVISVRAPGADGDSGPHVIPTSAFIDAIERHGDEVAILVLGAVHFLTGQFFDIAAITRAAHAKGIVVGVDAAHAVGNVPLRFHEWGVDFACWCTYKYLNGGPGNIAGAFVHSKHADAVAQPDGAFAGFRGWWGHRRTNRFALHRTFDAAAGAASVFQLSNPCVVAIASLTPSLTLCADIGLEALRRKSLLLTGLLERLIRQRLAHAVEIITPADPSQRGCQLSVRLVPGKLRSRAAATEAYACGNDVNNDADLAQRQLLELGVMCDNRPPDILRLAPAPTYNSFEDVFELVRCLERMF